MIQSCENLGFTSNPKDRTYSSTTLLAPWQSIKSEGKCITFQITNSNSCSTWCLIKEISHLNADPASNLLTSGDQARSPFTMVISQRGRRKRWSLPSSSVWSNLWVHFCIAFSLATLLFCQVSPTVLSPPHALLCSSSGNLLLVRSNSDVAIRWETATWPDVGDSSNEIPPACYGNRIQSGHRGYLM